MLKIRDIDDLELYIYYDKVQKAYIIGLDLRSNRNNSVQLRSYSDYLKVRHNFTYHNPGLLKKFEDTIEKRTEFFKLIRRLSGIAFPPRIFEDIKSSEEVGYKIKGQFKKI